MRNLPALNAEQVSPLFIVGHFGPRLALPVGHPDRSIGFLCVSMVVHVSRWLRMRIIYKKEIVVIHISGSIGSCRRRAEE